MQCPLTGCKKQLQARVVSKRGEIRLFELYCEGPHSADALAQQFAKPSKPATPRDPRVRRGE